MIDLESYVREMRARSVTSKHAHKPTMRTAYSIFNIFMMLIYVVVWTQKIDIPLWPRQIPQTFYQYLGLHFKKKEQYYYIVRLHYLNKFLQMCSLRLKWVEGMHAKRILTNGASWASCIT